MEVKSHELCVSELPFLPIPQDIKQSVVIKLSQGVASEHILDGM